jgi:hypothetical protein
MNLPVVPSGGLLKMMAGEADVLLCWKDPDRQEIPATKNNPRNNNLFRRLGRK